MATPVLITHIDDVACSHSANVAMTELSAAGAVSSGSVMVPPSWFPEIAGHSRLQDLDLGIHLTLTSESAAFRWRPISTISRASGLFDDDGYMWARVPQLRRAAVPEAVEGELRAQVERALRAGIDVTHLDHHMGAALAPEFVEATVRVASEYRIPLLFPADLRGYLGVLDVGEVGMAVLEDARLKAGELAVGDAFLMGLTYQQETDYRGVFARMLAGLPAGVTYLSLHCSSPGDIEQIHPKDAHWRIGEYHLFSDAGFLSWLRAQPLRLVGMRGYRDAIRKGSAG
jgi:predicted glycoside hydrolase/deacetylase ChbG (UPF0249 family)